MPSLVIISLIAGPPNSGMKTSSLPVENPTIAACLIGFDSWNYDILALERVTSKKFVLLFSFALPLDEGKNGQFFTQFNAGALLLVILTRVFIKSVFWNWSIFHRIGFVARF